MNTATKKILGDFPSPWAPRTDSDKYRPIDSIENDGTTQRQ